MKNLEGLNQPMTPSYFVTTLGEAKRLNALHNADENSRNEDSIPALIDSRAELYPDVPVVGEFLPVLQNGVDWSFRCFNFSQLARGTSALAQHMIATGLPVAGKPTLLNSGSRAQQNHLYATVALLCPSSVDFLFHWIALMKLGYAVLLLAPQLTHTQLSHLCQATGVSFLISHPMYTPQGGRNGPWTKLTTIQLFPSHIYLEPPHDQEILPTPSWVNSQCIAYIHHTSGTSSNQPKPIPQTHAGATTCLLRYPTPIDQRNAQFTATPLYSGGIADLMRGMNSLNFTWLHPSTIPFTSGYLAKMFCMASMMDKEYQISYFSSVPYIVKLLAETDEGMHWLQSCKMVGIGGAPLEKPVGDRLVKAGVNLVSRYGSTEAGFMMSSFRKFDTEFDWDYLRGENEQHLTFEGREDSYDGKKYELIVGAAWPNLLKHNRPDGSFGTCDLFVSGGNEKWKYTGRSDALLVLMSGKKFDPIPLEYSIAHHPLISSVVSDVCIFVGPGKNTPGVIVTHTASKDEIRALHHKVKQVIKAVNAKSNSPRHAWIAEDLIILDRGMRLPKNSKGAVIRARVMEIYADFINEKYTIHEYSQRCTGLSKETNDIVTDFSQYNLRKQGIEDLVSFVGAVVRGVFVEWNTGTAINENDGKTVGLAAEVAIKDLQNDTDLFSFGVDSVMALEIRSRLMKALKLDSKFEGGFGMNIVFEQGNIMRLAEHIIAVALGKFTRDPIKEDNLDEQVMWEMVRKYTTSPNLLDSAIAPDSSTGIGIPENIDYPEVIVLTGATGSLGAHILNKYRESPRTKIIYCLVRAQNITAATERVSHSLQKRGLPDLSQPGKAIIKCFAAEHVEASLGLLVDTWDEILNELTLAGSKGVIIHAAWPVNFAARTESFENQFIGIRRLMKLLPNPGTIHHANSPKLTFISSTASVISTDNATGSIPETYSSNPKDAAALGYGRSKWVAEKICEFFRNQGYNIDIIRVGQLCGDTKHGYWNQSEGWPLMLAAGLSIKALPYLQEEVSWLPVDAAASMVLDTVYDKQEGNQGGRVFHVVNPRRVSWSKVLEWTKGSGKEFTIIPPTQWIARVKQWVKTSDLQQKNLQSSEENLEFNTNVIEQVKGLLPLWERKYGTTADPTMPSEMSFAVEATSGVSPIMASLLRDGNESKISNENGTRLVEGQILTQALMQRMIKRWEENGFI